MKNDTQNLQLEIARLQIQLIEAGKDVEELRLKVKDVSNQVVKLDQKVIKLNYDVSPLKKIIYGMVGIILVEFVTALIYMVMNIAK